MKMHKSIFTTIISKLGSFRCNGLLHFILDKNKDSAVRSPSGRFRGSGRGSSRCRWLSTSAQSDRRQEMEYVENRLLKGDDNQRQVAASHVLWSGMLRIGVLDDNSAILSLIETVLTMEGHKVSKHANGSSLLDALFPQQSEEWPQYDLVILDLLLPGAQSGVDVFFAIRQRFPADILPIIVITAVDEPTLKQFRHILPDDVPLLRKPFSPRKLRRLITELTGKMVNRG